ncbi:MAG: hypothetical protein WCP11_02785 [Candidatus Saccharibacteria bacterium]
MDFYTIFVVLSSVLTILAIIPYLVEIVRKNTKPRIVSWIVWTVITGISAVASLVDGQFATAILLFSAMLETLAVVVLGWKNSDKKIEKLDIVCFTGAMIGVILWQVFDSPALAVIATVLADFIGGIPTLVHAWKKPGEETAITFFLSGLGAVCTLLIVIDWQITSVAYPIFLVGINLLFTSVIVLRKRVLKKK